MPRRTRKGKGADFAMLLRPLCSLRGQGAGTARDIAAQKANLPIGKRQGRGYQAPKLTPGGGGHDVHVTPAILRYPRPRPSGHN